MPSKATLLVGGKAYGGWKAIHITRSLETLSGSFDLSVSDKWAGKDTWPIAEEDPCRVQIDGETVIAGYVDRRAISISAQSRDLSYSGRDLSSLLVDCSTEIGGYQFADATIDRIARLVAQQFGIPVSVQPGLDVTLRKKIAVSPGQTGFEVLAQAAAMNGILVISDGNGGIVLTRAASARASSIVEGENLLAASVDCDSTLRYHRYVVLSQVPKARPEVMRARAEATDEGVTRTDRVLYIRAEQSVTAEFARVRADWEARIRAARSKRVTVHVVGWRQPSGQLWPLNALVNVVSPSIGVGGDLLISQVAYELSAAGEITTLSLLRPDVFTPEPVQARVKKQGEKAFQDLKHGAR